MTRRRVGDRRLEKAGLSPAPSGGAGRPCAAGAAAGSLAHASGVDARLGGWTGYRGKPESLVMLEGRLEPQAAKRALTLLNNADGVLHAIADAPARPGHP